MSLPRPLSSFLYGLLSFDYEENYSHDPQFEFSVLGFVWLSVFTVGIATCFELTRDRKKKDGS